MNIFLNVLLYLLMLFVMFYNLFCIIFLFTFFNALRNLLGSQLYNVCTVALAITTLRKIKKSAFYKVIVNK